MHDERSQATLHKTKFDQRNGTCLMTTTTIACSAASDLNAIKMAAPAPDSVCPLTAIAQPVSDLVSQESKTLDVAKFNALLKQSLLLYHAGQTDFTPGRTFSMEHDANVQVFKGTPSKPPNARLARCAWHARKSTHDPDKEGHGLGYLDFYEGLAVDHPEKEKQYIHDILRYERVGQSIQPPSLRGAATSFIHAVRADVWVSEYKLPIITSNRDFVQMFLTVELEPHDDPLSKAHIDAIISALDGDVQQANDEQSTAAQTGKAASRRSCINIQLPVSTSECRPQSGFVRAFYGSVEVLRELDGDKTEWW